MRIVKSRLVPVVSLSLVLGCVQQGLTASDCSISAHHISGSEPVNMGEGIVTTERFVMMFSLGGDATSERSFIDCASGRRLTLTYFRAVPTAEGSERVIDAEETGARFDEEMTTAGFQSIDEIEAAAKARGLASRFREARDVESEEYETCGCRVFYPELRGDKIPYEVRS